ncbi:unnamed protein product [Ectocarpus sp. CCAP 1310/34]|nr:unnamed protein product [Ectocarpus sp. CCAP 1310/34]
MHCCCRFESWRASEIQVEDGHIPTTAASCSRQMMMKITSLAALLLLGGSAAQTATVGSCSDWPSTITTDTVLELTAAEVR